MRLAFVTLAFIFSSFSSEFLFYQTNIDVLTFSNLDGDFRIISGAMIYKIRLLKTNQVRFRGNIF